MRRRDFIAGVGGAAALPFAAAAQQALPVIGYLSAQARTAFPARIAAFRQGLKETGFAANENVAIEYRIADGQYDRLTALARELIDRRVEVIVTTGGNIAISAAKAATSTIPIVFTTGDDPVRLGLVASLNRPTGNVTGVSFLSVSLGAKRLSLLQDLLPSATAVSLLSCSCHRSRRLLHRPQTSNHRAGRALFDTDHIPHTRIHHRRGSY
jgi:putative ABC transport system substrate-binding protein